LGCGVGEISVSALMQYIVQECLEVKRRTNRKPKMIEMNIHLWHALLGEMDPAESADIVFSEKGWTIFGVLVTINGKNYIAVS
jgi:hypothetical protein